MKKNISKKTTYKYIDGVRHVKIFSDRVKEGYYWRKITRSKETKKRKPTRYNQLSKAISQSLKASGHAGEYGKFKTHSQLVSSYWKKHKEEIEDKEVDLYSHIQVNIKEVTQWQEPEACIDVLKEALLSINIFNFFDIARKVETIMETGCVGHSDSYRVLTRFRQTDTYFGKPSNRSEVDFSFRGQETPFGNIYKFASQLAKKYTYINTSDLIISALDDLQQPFIQQVDDLDGSKRNVVTFVWDLSEYGITKTEFQDLNYVFNASQDTDTSGVLPVLKASDKLSSIQYKQEQELIEERAEGLKRPEPAAGKAIQLSKMKIDIFTQNMERDLEELLQMKKDGELTAKEYLEEKKAIRETFATNIKGVK